MEVHLQNISFRCQAERSFIEQVIKHDRTFLFDVPLFLVVDITVDCSTMHTVYEIWSRVAHERSVKFLSGAPFLFLFFVAGATLRCCSIRGNFQFFAC